MRQKETRGEVFDQVDQWATFLLANLLWCICSLPVLTLPAATAGLFAVMSLRVRGKQPELFQEFFAGMRRHWRKATLLALLNILAVGLVALNVSIIPLMSEGDPLAFVSSSVTLFVCLGLAMLNLFLWPLLVTFNLPLRKLVEMAFRLAFGYPLWSLGMLLVVALIVAVSLLLPRAVLVLVTFGGAVYIVTWGTWKLIRRHTPEDELRLLEGHAPTALESLRKV